MPVIVSAAFWRTRHLAQGVPNFPGMATVAGRGKPSQRKQCPMIIRVLAWALGRAGTT
jgi:hypothetical protein